MWPGVAESGRRTGKKWPNARRQSTPVQYDIAQACLAGVYEAIIRSFDDSVEQQTIDNDERGGQRKREGMM